MTKTILAIIVGGLALAPAIVADVPIIGCVMLVTCVWAVVIAGEHLRSLAVAAVAVIGLLVAAAPAKAVVINIGDVGATGVTSIQGQIEGVNQPGLTGTLGLTYTGNVGGVWNFNYLVTNTSSAPVTNARISSFAFQTNPDIVSATATGVYNDPQIANGYPGFLPGTVEFCFGSSPGTCTGGGGLDIGQSALGTFSLTFASSSLTSIDLQTAYMRFQSILPGTLCGQSATQECSGAGFNSSVSITPLDVSPVPLPAVGTGLPGIIGGVAGLMYWFKKRRQRRLEMASAQLVAA